MLYRTIIVLFGFCVVAQCAAPAGLLSMVSGNVQIVPAGEKTPRPARTADLISAGDRVLTGPGAEATFVFCPESRSAKMLAGTEIQFDAATLQVLKGKLSDERKLPSCRLPASLALAGASKLQSGMLRLRGSDLVLLSPSRTNVDNLLPRFRWDPVDNATTYGLKLMDREERVLWSQNTAATELQYPSSAPALAFGQKYWWRVTAREGEDTLTEVGSYFEVLPKEQADQLVALEESLRRTIRENPADTGSLFLLAFLYDDNGMLDQAARVYGQIAQVNGSQAWLQGRLTELMNKLGWGKVDVVPVR